MPINFYPKKYAVESLSISSEIFVSQLYKLL